MWSGAVETRTRAPSALVPRFAPATRDRPSRQMRQPYGARLTAICSSRSFKQLEQMLKSALERIAPSARSDVPPFMVMDVMAAAPRLEAAGIHVVPMEVGQPAAPAPATALAAARAALGGRIAYTEALGIPSLRARVARHYG